MKVEWITKQLAYVLALFFFVQGYASAYSGGEGTSASPYLLSCREDVMELASRPDDYDKSFMVTEDIDLEAALFEGPIIAPDVVFVPAFGEYDGLFAGGFNGNGHVIENFTIIGGGALGFFGGIGRGGRVMHLALRNVCIDGADASNAGMLAGINMGHVVGCYTEGRITSHGNVGGLVGYQLRGHILDCFSRGYVEGVAGAVGGLLGALAEGDIWRCYAACTVVGGNAGGLVGMSPSGGRGTPPRVVSSSFWDTDLSGVFASRGGLGLSTEQMYEVSTYIDAGWDFAAEQRDGIVDMWIAPEDAGYPVLAAFSSAEPVWLVGEGTADSPYLVSAARELAAMIYYAGGRCCALDADIDLSGIEWLAPVVSEFDGHLDGCGHRIHGFHQYASSGFFGKIKNSATVTGLHLEMTAVEAGDETAGCLAGENYGKVAGCSVSGFIRAGAVTGGLVGYNQGEVSACSFAGASMGNGQAGGLAGENAGIVINSYSQGAVSGAAHVGGLAGLNGGSIRSCYSTAAIVGCANLGGLVGSNASIVGDCYARGSVAGAYYIGGLIGQNWRDVSRCYSTGAVSGLRDVGGLIGYDDFGADAAVYSFWDTDTSQMLASAGGTGVSMSEMRDIETFLKAGWDFVEETDNGTEDLWAIGDDGYPDLTLSLEVPRRTR
ncbi:MAG: hypothetical protein GXY19_18370 [Phycisphaerae bacterium]|nr:hypothetical protein [Phycisphaerae bacterium]